MMKWCLSFVKGPTANNTPMNSKITNMHMQHTHNLHIFYLLWDPKNQKAPLWEIWGEFCEMKWGIWVLENVGELWFYIVPILSDVVGDFSKCGEIIYERILMYLYIGCIYPLFCEGGRVNAWSERLKNKSWMIGLCSFIKKKYDLILSIIS